MRVHRWYNGDDIDIQWFLHVMMHKQPTLLDLHLNGNVLFSLTYKGFCMFWSQAANTSGFEPEARNELFCLTMFLSFAAASKQTPEHEPAPLPRLSKSKEPATEKACKQCIWATGINSAQPPARIENTTEVPQCHYEALWCKCCDNSAVMYKLSKLLLTHTYF